MSALVIDGDCRDVLRTLPAESVHCCVTSPPYFGLRDYGVDGQMGLEASPDEFVSSMVEVFREVRRVLRADGTLWLNIGDSYASSGGQSPQMGAQFNGRARQRDNVCISARVKTHGCKTKDLIGIPWMLAFALRADGWYLRQDIIWHKSNPMPESVRDRCTKSHEYVFLLSKSERYYFDADSIREPLSEKTLTTFGTRRKSKGTDAIGKIASHNWMESAPERKPRLKDDGSFAGANKRSVWTIATKPFKGAHFATFPPALVEPCILAGSPRGGTVLDPFGGAGTTGLAADRLQRNAVLIELNPEYADMARRRITAEAPLLAGLDSDREVVA